MLEKVHQKMLKKMHKNAEKKLHTTKHPYMTAWSHGAAKA